MTTGMGVPEELARSLARVRVAVLVWLLACAIATQVLTPPVASGRSSLAGLYAALACALVALLARGIARSPGTAARARLHAFLVGYGAAALLGVVALGIFFMIGDASQALGAALAGAIFAASGARPTPQRPARR